MSRRIKYWLDSGANIHSCRSGVIDIEETGYAPEEWDAMTEAQQEEVMREFAFANADWGFGEIEGEEA